MHYGYNSNQFRPKEPHGYPEMSLLEIEEALAQCEQDLSSRAVTAALRICREQLIAREVNLAPPAVLVGIAGGIGASFLVYAWDGALWPPSGWHLGFLVAVGIMAVGFYWDVEPRKERARKRRERKVVRVMTARTLSILAREGVEPEPLEKEKYEVLRHLIRVEKREDLERLLIR